MYGFPLRVYWSMKIHTGYALLWCMWHACISICLSLWVPLVGGVQPRICTNRDDLDLQIGLSDWPVEMRNSPWFEFDKHPFNLIWKLCPIYSGAHYLDRLDQFHVQLRGCAYLCGYLYSASVIVHLCVSIF